MATSDAGSPSGNRSPRGSSLMLNVLTVGLVVLLLVYLIQFEDSLLRIAARSVLTLALPAGLRRSAEPQVPIGVDVGADAEWERGGEAEPSAVEPLGADSAGGAIGGGGGPANDLDNDESPFTPSSNACFSILDSLPLDSKRKVTTEAITQACACRARGGPSVAPPSFSVPLMWWASARISAFSGWANGARPALGGEYTWHYGFILERPVESYPHVFWNRSLLAWQSGMLFTPTYWLAGRLAVNLSTAEACEVALQGTAPVTTRERAGSVWHERFGVNGVRPLVTAEDAQLGGPDVAAPGSDDADSGSTDDVADDGHAGSKRDALRDAVAEEGSRRSPFYLEAMRRGWEAMAQAIVQGSSPSSDAAAAGRRAEKTTPPGPPPPSQAQLASLLSGGWVTPAALEAGMKGMSSDLAVGEHAGARVHMHRPLSQVIVPRFYPDIFLEVGAWHLAVMPPNSTAIRDWAFVSGVVHNVTHYMVTYAGVFFRKLETAVVRLNRVRTPREVASEAESSGGGGALSRTLSPSVSPNPTPGTPDFAGWMEAHTITGVSVRACKVMPTPGASRPPTPTPVAVAHFPSAMQVDEYLPIMHRWHSNVYHLYGETVTRALGVYPFVDHSRGYIAGDQGLVRGLRLLSRWRARDMTVDRDAPPLVAAKSLHLVDPMLCQMTSANELLLLRESIRAALGMPPPSLGYLRAPIVRNTAAVARRIRKAGAISALPAASPAAVSKYRCPELMYRQPSVILVRRRGTRRIMNYHSLLTSLSASGAAVTVFDEDNIPPPLETFALFARADVVIGVHGAGLTNIIASSPGAAVFEILTTAFPGLHYAEYSVVMGLEYHRWEVAPVAPEPVPLPGESNEHFQLRMNTTKDKDSNVVAPLGEVMGSICAYLANRFGVTREEAEGHLATGTHGRSTAGKPTSSKHHQHVRGNQ